MQACGWLATPGSTEIPSCFSQNRRGLRKDRAGETSGIFELRCPPARHASRINGQILHADGGAIWPLDAQPFG
jgi:hypothetical protein